MQTVDLAPGGRLSKEVLELTNSHPSLMRLLIKSVDLTEDTCPPVAPGERYPKVAIASAVLNVEENQVPGAIKNESHKLYELGIPLETLQVQDTRLRSYQDTRPWSTAKFSGLTAMTCSQFFRMEDSAVQNFFSRHPMLLQISITIQSYAQRRDWLHGSHITSPILKAAEPTLDTKADSCDIQEIRLQRASGIHTFQCSGVSVSLSDRFISKDSGSMILDRINQACPYLETLSIQTLPIPISSSNTTGVEVTVSFWICFFDLLIG